MTDSDMGDEALVAFLREHPDIRACVASMAPAVENADGDLGEADAAEERLVEDMRHRGLAALQGWAERRVAATERDIRRQPSIRRQGKKTLLAQQIRRRRGPGAAVPVGDGEGAPVRPRGEGQPAGLSRPLQRAIVDFAADQPFAQARAKLREHYGIGIGESTIQRITFGHAEAMFEAGRGGAAYPDAPGERRPIVVQTDGGMVPTVAPDPAAADKRKSKTLSWREAKLSLAHVQGSVTPVYAGSIAGGVEAAGRQLPACAVRAGFGTGSRVHAAGDGAAWIVGQVEQQFGGQARYLIDFYHVCEYLSAAATGIWPADTVAREAWIETQKAALKAGRLDAVLQALAAQYEAPEVEDEQAPVRNCNRYLSGRRTQLDYSRALADGLPIGSGEIESAHRYVAQQRLKRPGAWWRVENAEYMLALRIVRINGDWEAYCRDRARNVAANDNPARRAGRRVA